MRLVLDVNWTISSQANGYVIVYVDSTGNRNVLSTTETESVINNLPLSTLLLLLFSLLVICSKQAIHKETI